MKLRSALFWVVTQRIEVIYYRRFRRTYRSYLPESIRNYHYTRRHNPEERRSHFLRGVSLKSLIGEVVLIQALKVYMGAEV